MPDNAQKTPLVRSLETWWGDKGESHDALQGRFAPASVVSLSGGTQTIVTAKIEILDDTITFPYVVCPLVGPEYIRFPIRAGTKGLVISSEYYLGAMTGLGSGQARIEKQSNLSTLSFLPLGNVGFEDVIDPNSVEIYGEGDGGVILRSNDGNVELRLRKGGKGGVMVTGELGKNILGANLIEAADDAAAKAQGIPFNGFYYDPDGFVHLQRIPD